MRRATLGTHVARIPSPIASRREQVNPRRTRNVERGEIHQVLPNTSTRESRRDYTNRMSQQAFIERAVASSRRRKIAFAIVLAVVALAVASAAAWFVFIGGVNDRLRIQDPALSSVLADAPAEGPVYTVLAASYDDGDGGSGPDVALLVRTDSATASASAVVIPGNARVKLSDGNAHRLGEAQTLGGDAEVVSAIEEPFGRPGFPLRENRCRRIRLVGRFGRGRRGESVRAGKRPGCGFDDPSCRIPGPLGEQALFLCRANDFAASPEMQRGLNESQVAQALFKKFVGMDKLSFYTGMDGFSDCVKTDMDVKSAYAMMSSLRDIVAESVMTGVMPTYLSKAGDVVYQEPISDEWKAMMERFVAGDVPQQDKESIIESVDPASFTITVNNGGSVEGAAADAASILEGAGFTVDSVGNANQAVYESTLIVYQKSENEAKAEAIVATLGTGRAVLDAVNYSFETDILVVVGKDWQAVLDAREKTAAPTTTNAS